MAHAESLGQFVEGDNGGVTLPPFKAAYVLLAETGAGFHILLAQPPFTAQPSEVPSHQSAHIHARTDCRLSAMGLSTIICIWAEGSKVRRRAAIDRLEQIKAETLQEMEVVKKAGGNVQFLLAYHQYLNELQSGDRDTVAQTGRRFLRRPLQIAAVAAMRDQERLATHKGDIPDFDEALSDRVESVARTAYVGAAGHHEEQALAHIPETSPEAEDRRRRAGLDWDRLLTTDLYGLTHLSIFGREASKSPPMTLMDHIRGVGSLVGLAVLAMGVYYVWTHRL